MNKMNVGQEIEIIKRNQKKFKPNYNNWNEKFTIRVQWQFWGGRKPNEQLKWPGLKRRKKKKKWSKKKRAWESCIKMCIIGT